MTEPTMEPQASAGPNHASGFSGPDKPSHEDYDRCVHCGLCLNNCPTYKLWGLEADSPRGRIRQIILVDQGRLPLGDSFVKHIDQCLDCRACETACPSGVEYGKLVEAARAQIEQNYRRPFFSRVTRGFIFRRLLPYPSRIANAARALRFYQRSGLQSLARATGVLRLLGLADRERLLPPIDQQNSFSRVRAKHFAGNHRPTRRGSAWLYSPGASRKVQFFRVARSDDSRVLTANGCEVVVPAGANLLRRACSPCRSARCRAIARARVNLDVLSPRRF